MNKQDEILIQRIRRYNWQSRRKQPMELGSSWYGDEEDFLVSSPVDEWPSRGYQPATQEQLRETEDLLGFSLPPLLRVLYLQIANGGFGPGYGIIGAMGGFPLEDRMGKNIAQGYLDRVQACTSRVRLDEHEMISQAQWYRQLKQMPPDQVVGWDNAPLQLPAVIKPEWKERFLYEFPHGVWPNRLLPLCYWGCGICSYLDARTEHIFQGAASERGRHYLLVFSAASLVEWFERWMAGEALQLL